MAKIPLSIPIVSTVSLKPISGPALPLAHYALSLLALPAAFAVALWKAPAMIRFFYMPENLAATHLITLGVLTGIALGSLQALLPPGPSMRWRLASGWTGFAVYTAGMLYFVVRLLQGDLEKIWPGAAIVFTGICIELSGLLPTMFSLRHFDASVVGILLAQVNLLLAGGAGLLYAIDKKHPFLQWNFFDRLYAHVHLAVGGFLLTLFVAVAHQLIPMFLWSDNPRRRFHWTAVLLTGLGSIGLFLLLITGMPWWPGALAVAAGFILFVLDGHGFVKTRRRAFPAVLRQTMAGEISLIVVAVLAILIWRGGAPQDDPSFRLRFAYGILLVIGALPAMVLGVLGRLAPEIVWYAKLRPSPGVPVKIKPEGLMRNRAWLVAGLVMLAGTALLALAAGRNALQDFRVAAAVALIGALLHTLLFLDLYLWLVPSIRVARLARIPDIDPASLMGNKDETRAAAKQA